MMNEEQYIKSRMNGKNPFRVPDGYFDNLTANIMQQLPEQPKRSVIARMRPWLYAAACMIAVIFSATLYFYSPSISGQQVASFDHENVTESYIDEAADFVMADNTDIYACLTSEY